MISISKRCALIAAISLSLVTSILAEAVQVSDQNVFEQVQTSALTKSITMYAAKTNDAYLWSMPVVAAGMAGNKALFYRYMSTFMLMIDGTDELHSDDQKSWMANPSFKMWMLGRLLVSADSVGDPSAKAIAENMHSHLTNNLYAPAIFTSQTAFAAWAVGYLESYYAVASPEQYGLYKPMLVKAVSYQQAHYDVTIDMPKPSFVDMMWTYTMAIQASALAKDKIAYTHFIQGMSTLGGNNHTIEAAVTKLKKGDYPVWLISILEGSARRMNDVALANSLRNTLRQREGVPTASRDDMLGRATQIYFTRLSVNSLSKQDLINEVVLSRLSH